MRSIGKIPADRDAEAFSNHLVTQGVANMVEQSALTSDWLVWVENDDQLEQATTELETFLAGKADATIERSKRLAQEIRKEQEKNETKRRKNFVDVRTSWSSAKRGKTPVTIALVAICVVIAFVTRGGAEGYVDQVGKYLYFANPYSSAQPTADDDGTQRVQRPSLPSRAGKSRTSAYRAMFRDISHGQVWRLVTPMLLHFGVMHILFNMFWLLDLGVMIEAKRSSLFLLSFVLISSAVANVFQVAWSPSPYFGGMSGVVYALFGYVWMKGRFQPELGMGMSNQNVLIMLGWLVLCMTGMLGPIANAAHVGGLVAGVVAGYAPIGWRRIKRQLRG